MKRNILIGIVLSLCTVFLASASFGQTFTQVWKVSPGTWPMVSSNASAGAALDRATGHYLVTRMDIPMIYVFDASNGTLLDSLNMTGVTGGTSKIRDIEATSDGVIYGSNLILGTGSDTTLKIYRWADDNSATVPTVAFSGRPIDKNGRFGDALDVAGTGTGTVIYVGGNNTATDSMLVFTTTDGSTFTNSGFIKIAGNDAGAGIAQVTPGGNFYTSRYATNNPVRLYSSSGTRLDAVPTTVIPALQADIAYLSAGGREWLAACDSAATANASGAVLLNITYGLSGAMKVGRTPRMGANANAATVGSDVELQYNAADSTMTLYVLIDNNGIAAFKTGNLLATNLPPFVKSVTRGPYVPLSGQADTVYSTILDDNGIAAATLHYSVNGGADSLVVMTRSSGDSLNGNYWAVIPGARNSNATRISYKVEAHDISADTVWSATTGYFAGITPLSITGARAVDTTTGILLYKGYGIRIQGVCTLEDSVTYNYQLDVIVQDVAGAADVYQSSSLGGISTNFVRGNQYTIAGTIDQYNGKIEVASNSTFKLDIADNGHSSLPQPKLVTLHDLAWSLQGEQLENSLVRVEHVTLTESSLAWPGVGAGGTNLTITDNPGVDSMTLRIPAWTNLNGFTPRQPFTLVGVANQYDNSNPYTAGYQLIARDQNDVAAEISLAVDTAANQVNHVVTVPVMLVDSADGLNITSFQFHVMWDTTKLMYAGSSVSKTLSNGYTLADNVTSPGNGMVAASGATALTGKGTFLNLMFRFRVADTSTITVEGQFNEGSPVPAPATGVVIGNPIPREIVGINNKLFKTAVTNIGHFGALHGYQDSTGFVFNGAERMYEGSLIFATDQNHVSNAARFPTSPNWNPGLRPADDVTVTTTGSKIYTHTAFDDGNQAHPLGLFVEQTTYCDTSHSRNGYLMIMLNVKNGSASALSNLRVGSFFDFDITPSTGNDRGGIVIDSTNTISGFNSNQPFNIHVAYERQDPAANFIGLVPLSQTVFKGGRIAIGSTEVYSGRMTDSAKFTYISTFRATNRWTDGGTATDLSIFSSVGPYATVNPNDSVQAAFAIVAGNDLAELVANARLAQKDYFAMGHSINVLTGVQNYTDQLPTRFDLSQNFPNPFNPTTMIRFALPNDAKVSLKVYDMLGREVCTLIDGNVRAGFNEVMWDGRNNAGIQVATGMYIYRITAGSFVSSKKMLLLK